MQKVFMWSVVGIAMSLVMTGCGGTDELAESPSEISVTLRDSDGAIEQEAGVVCWQDCTDNHVGFHIDHIEDAVWNDSEVNQIAAEEVTIHVEEGNSPDQLLFFANVRGERGTTGYNQHLTSNVVKIGEGSSDYMIGAQWYNPNDELVGDVYTVFKTE
ncbi:hypothetical protein ACE1TH_13635 [Shouchella sp. JSM 1781072]|uniref:hypothetical protein n=1 Tax=Shouchella sp. JSM 1781072 TaxID=3344581 RepID=UPI0035BF5116